MKNIQCIRHTFNLVRLHVLYHFTLKDEVQTTSCTKNWLDPWVHNQNLNVQLADDNEQSTPENSMGPTLFNILINDLDDGKVPTDNTRLCGMTENKKQSFSSQEP